MNLFTSDGRRLQAVESGTAYASPDGRLINVSSNMGVLFSDDFGGAAIDTTRWDVYSGGLGAVTQSTGAQAAIGSGVNAGPISASVAASALTVAMGTGNGDEWWLLSKQIFAGAEDITVILSKSQSIAANSFFVGLVEVDITTGYPILNPNLAADFTNRGGVDFGKTTSNTSAFLEAVADSSNAVASTTATGWTVANTSTTFETCIEFHAEDLIASTCSIDTATARNSVVYRVSSQCPNDGKAYKLLIRAKNVSAPGSGTSVVIQRVLVVNNQEQRVGINSSGSQNGQQAVPVNLGSPQADNAALTSVGAMVGGIINAGSGGPSAATAARFGALYLDLARRLIVKPLGNAPSHDFNRIAALATTTETTLIAAVAAIRHDVQSITVANHDTVACIVDFRDTTAGTIRATLKVPAGDTRELLRPAGMPSAAVNTNWTAQLRAATTTNGVDIFSSSYRTTA